MYTIHQFETFTTPPQSSLWYQDFFIFLPSTHFPSLPDSQVRWIFTVAYEMEGTAVVLQGQALKYGTSNEQSQGHAQLISQRKAKQHCLKNWWLRHSSLTVTKGMWTKADGATIEYCGKFTLFDSLGFGLQKDGQGTKRRVQFSAQGRDQT